MTACICLAPTAQSASCLTNTAVRSPFLSWPSRPQYARSCTAQKGTPGKSQPNYLLSTVLQSFLAEIARESQYYIKAQQNHRHSGSFVQAFICFMHDTELLAQQNNPQLLSLLEMPPSRKHMQQKKQTCTGGVQHVFNLYQF